MRFRWAIYLLILGLVTFMPLPKALSTSSSAPLMETQEVCLCLVEPKPQPKPKPIEQPKPKPKPKPKPVEVPKPSPAPEPPVVEEPEPTPEPIIDDTPVEEMAEEETVPEEETEEAAEEIEETAETEEAPLAPMEPQVNVKALKATYFTEVRELIASKKRYPKKALRFHQEGDVTVTFSIDATGRLLEYAIKEKSRHISLNRGALKIFKLLGAFPKPPEGLEYPLEMTITINYTIKE